MIEKMYIDNSANNRSQGTLRAPAAESFANRLDQPRGLRHRTPGKREKSESVETSSQQCSTANAARCASVTRFATACPLINIFWKTDQ